ncbi:hypothetical protein [Planktothrix phage Pra-JY27]|nr:hypothetical protein [Planktothrix phage Pag-Yong1]WEV89259.1 hypothetical protein [Synechococcus phage MinM2]
MTSNSINVASAAADIIAPLAKAKSLAEEKKENGQEFTAEINAATLGSYAACAVVVRSMLDQGIWSTGKQKKGVISASAGLKAAIEAEAKAKAVSPAKAKRVVEKAAAILDGKKKIDAVFEAAAESADAVISALAEAEIKKEADIIRHVEGEPEKDPVAATLKKIAKFNDQQRVEFLKALRNQEGVEIIESAAAPGKAEKAAAEKAAAEKAASGKVVSLPSRAPSNPDVADRRAAERAAKKAQAPAEPATPKKGRGKKGAAEAPVSADEAANKVAADPFG